MTGDRDPRRAIVDELLSVLDTPSGLRVYDGETPPDVDRTKPWCVLEVPGGDIVMPSQTPGDQWEFTVRLRSVGVDPDTRGGIGWTSARQAAQWAAEHMASAILDAAVQVSTTGWAVGGSRLLSSSGVMREGDTANISDDYVLSVSSA